MKNRKIIITIIMAIVFIIVIAGFGLRNPTSVPTSQLPQAPKTFKFDRSTDLKSELDKINPQILDADFN